MIAPRIKVAEWDLICSYSRWSVAHVRIMGSMQFPSGGVERDSGAGSSPWLQIGWGLIAIYNGLDYNGFDLEEELMML